MSDYLKPESEEWYNEQLKESTRDRILALPRPDHPPIYAVEIELDVLEKFIDQEVIRELEGILRVSETDGFDVHDHMDWKGLIQDRIERRKS